MKGISDKLNVIMLCVVETIDNFYAGLVIIIQILDHLLFLKMILTDFACRTFQ